MHWWKIVAAAAGIALVLLGVWYVNTGPRIVLYSAQDEEYAEEVLKLFQDSEGIAVTKKFDSEAAKSVSLYEELVSEKGRPRCDVFWNNEVLSTIRLTRLGLLQPYDSPAAHALRPLPASAVSADHSWHAFAARARVLLVNTKLLPEKDWPTSLLDLTDAKYRGQVVMAKPWAGTSATQAVCLFEVLGTEQASKYYQGLSDNGLNICPGNAQAAEWISAGQTPKGQRVVVSITDTDDAIKEVKAGHPVRILFPDRKGGANSCMGTLFIPNTLAILKNCPNPEGARRLVDYLLAPETEKKLAEGGGYQIPLNPEVKAKLPPEIEQARTAKAMDVNFDKAANRWEEATGFVRRLFDR